MDISIAYLLLCVLQALQKKVDITNFEYKKIPRPNEGKSG